MPEVKIAKGVFPEKRELPGGIRGSGPKGRVLRIKLFFPRKKLSLRE